jgi:methylthioribose-1-phosphate isomerase
MRINGKPYRSIWLNENGWSVDIIDQTLLPHDMTVRSLQSLEQAAEAISNMRVRGAPLIGATAAYGVALAMRHDPGDSSLNRACRQLLSTRPTAVNLRWALDRLTRALEDMAATERCAAAYAMAYDICNEDVEINSRIGEHGLALIRGLWEGAALTAWELAAHGVPHDVIVDNAGGHLMQHGQVDLCITGTDRTARNGDVCNKIGTYLKALAAADNGIPFYVGLPSPTIDWEMSDGGAGIPIEERDASEVIWVSGKNPAGIVDSVQITPDGVSARNYAFDVTPARLVTGLITERGICPASEAGLLSTFPDHQ